MVFNLQTFTGKPLSLSDVTVTCYKVCTSLPSSPYNSQTSLSFLAITNKAFKHLQKAELKEVIRPVDVELVVINSIDFSGTFCNAPTKKLSRWLKDL